MTLDELHDAPPEPSEPERELRRSREIDTILVSYLLDLDPVG